MFFRKNKTERIRVLKEKVKNLQKKLSDSEHRYATEIGKLAKAQVEWQQKADNFLAYKTSIQETLKQIEARNNFDKIKTGAIAGHIDFIERKFHDAEKNILHGKKHLEN